MKFIAKFSKNSAIYTRPVYAPDLRQAIESAIAVAKYNEEQLVTVKRDQSFGGTTVREYNVDKLLDSVKDWELL